MSTMNDKVTTLLAPLMDFAVPYDLSDIYNLGLGTVETTQRYVCGQRSISEDGAVDKYCYASVAVASEFGAVNIHGGNSAGSVYSNTISSHVIPVAASIGDRQIQVTIGAYDGDASGGLVYANELIGGYAIVGNGTSQHPETIRIIGNTGIATGGGVITVYLKRPLSIALTASTSYCEILANPYSMTENANTLNSAYATVVCVPQTVAAAGNFYWGRTWGPKWVTSDNKTGYDANARSLWFMQNGSLSSGSQVTFTSYHPLWQYAGYAMELTSASHSGPPLCYLQLAT